MAKIIVLGGGGMLGHKMFQTLCQGFEDVGCTLRGARDQAPYNAIEFFRHGQVFEGVDAMDFAGLAALLRSQKPRLIVNCIGIIKQRREASAPIPSIALNALLPHKLAAWSATWGGRLTHFSSDCVFDGKRGGYRETDPATAQDLYGRSKFLGEVGQKNTLTLRTSMIGRELFHFESLLEWFLSQRGKAIRGFARVIYAGVTNIYLADLVGRLLNDHPTLCGLYQVTAPAISKYDLLCRLRDAFNLEVTIEREEETVADRSLIGEELRRATGYPEPIWEALVEQLAADPTPYHLWR